MADTRQQVEKEIEQRSASIAGSIARIKNDLSLPTKPLRAAVRKHPLEVILGSVIVGLVCGWVVSGKKEESVNGLQPLDGRGVHADADVFVRLVDDGRAAGLGETEALARALAVRSDSTGRRPRATLLDRLGDQAMGVAETVLRTAFSVVTREAASWLADAIRRDKPRSSQ